MKFKSIVKNLRKYLPRPYIVPGTFSSIRIPFNDFLQKITKGGENMLVCYFMVGYHGPHTVSHIAALNFT